MEALREDVGGEPTGPPGLTGSSELSVSTELPSASSGSSGQPHPADSVGAALGLDASAIHKLKGISASQANEILTRLPPDVRNPSAYVSRAVENITRNDASYQAQVYSAVPPSTWTLIQPGQKGQRPQATPEHLVNEMRQSLDWSGEHPADNPTLVGLDAGAIEKLKQLPPSKAQDILNDIPGDNVRNPSAYVQRAVANALREHGPTLTVDKALYQAGMSDQVDSRAWDYLTKIQPERALDIIALAQNPSVNNKSAFISRAVSNEMSSIQSWQYDSSWNSWSSGGWQDQSDYNQWSGLYALMQVIVPHLNETARYMLAEMPPHAAQEIVTGLSPSIKDLSGHICKACLAWKGSASPLEVLIAQYGLPLDERARKALEQVSPEEATNILDAASQGNVNNKNAFVTKSVANSVNGTKPVQAQGWGAQVFPGALVRSHPY